MTGSRPVRHQLAPTIAAWVMRAAIVATAALHFSRGDVPYAVFCIAGVLVAFVPEIAARTHRIRFPTEVEIVLLLIILADMTVGRAIGVYDLFPWYDKLLHLGSSFLIAMIAFMMVYVLHFVGHTRPHFWIDALTILLISLGLGAAWEIGEYLVDVVLQRATQGSPNMSPLEDTMVDLMLDGAGGVLAAILGPLYIRHSKRSRRQVEAFATLMRARGGVRHRS